MLQERKMEQIKQVLHVLCMCAVCVWSSAACMSPAVEQAATYLELNICLDAACIDTAAAYQMLYAYIAIVRDSAIRRRWEG